jgi:cell wall-associated NlpC family hydrolase
MMFRRRLAASLALAVALAISASACASARSSAFGRWDAAQQRAVLGAELMAPAADGRFHGERPLSDGQLRDALAGVALRLGTPPVSVRPGRVTVQGLDRALVEQLGLLDVARAVQAEAARAGLRPPGRFGTEVVARALGLRFNHPAGRDGLELYPTDDVSRAEAAWSLARIAHFDGWEVQGVRDAFAFFHLPRYTTAQRRALALAVSKIGMPYVWGGEADGRASVFGAQAHGGYDCSGFVWRVFKLSGNPAGRAIGGRTAAQMAGEIPRSHRIRLDAVRPGDLLFFGPASFHARATERSIVHVGIALSPEWMIHSSDQGVFVSSLADSWRRAEFSWARRVL